MGSKLELVQAALAAVRGGDIEAAAGVVADDFVWHIPGTSAIGGDVVGAAAWSEKLHRLLAAGLQPEMIGMLEGEGHVAALQRNRAQADAASLDVQVVNVFTVEDGRVARLDTFFGDQPAAERFWNAVLA